MKSKKALFAVCLLCIAVISALLFLNKDADPLSPFLDDSATVTQIRSLTSEEGEILRYSVTLSRGKARAWVFPDGAVFWCEESCAFDLSLDGFSTSKSLSEDIRSPILASGKNGSLLIQPPLARESVDLDGTNYLAADFENGTVSPKADAVNINFDGETSDWWAYLTPNVISDAPWISVCTVEKFGADNRMTLDGYYYTAPSDYTPSGKGVYYRNPAAYIPAKLVRLSDNTQARQIAVAMLDLQREHYTDEGYIPTMSMSNWLFEDYGIAEGFYDTRFNTDLAHALLLSGVEELQQHAMKYADFLVSHANLHSFPTENGILVEDYSHPDGNSPTHSSLNHHLAEILFLLETQDKAAEDIAKLMLYGVEDTVESWILPDGNLNYARYSDGTYGGTDYPYLTYNDLFALDRYLGGNPSLQRLMDAKREWMDNNGVTDYNK